MTANHIARMSAKRLTPKFGDDLPFAVEKVIQSDTAEPGQFVGIVEVASVAMFIVQCAQFAYEWRKGRRAAEKSDIEALRRELRQELGLDLPEGVGEQRSDEVIEAVAEETEAEE